MKAILEFNLDDEYDRDAHKKALQGAHYALFVWDYWNDVIRPLYKHGVPENLQDVDKLVEHMREQFLEILHSYDLKVD